MLSFIEKGFALYTMVAVCALGIIGKLAANHIYKSLIRQSDNLTTADDKYLKQMKTKYESTYRMNAGVRNVSSFVEKNMYKYSRHGVNLYRLENSSLHGALLCFIFGLCGTLIGFLYNAEIKTIVLQFSIGIILAVGMILADSLIDTSGKKDALNAHLCDYLTNTLIVRTSQELAEERTEGKTMAKGTMKDDIFMRKGKERRPVRPASRTKENEKDVEALKKSLAQIAASKEGDVSGNPKKLTPKEEKLIEDIISEYLT